MADQLRPLVGDAMQGHTPRQPNQFKSMPYVILSCLGCAVGTGNIWRFPRIVANNSDDQGGLDFLLSWILFTFLWSVPLLVIEYGMGRYTKQGVVGSVRYLISSRATGLGVWIVMVSFLVSCYYVVILAWCLHYCLYICLFEGLPTTQQQSIDTFHHFAVESKLPVAWCFIAIALAGLAVSRGVRTIQYVSIVLVPALLIIILVAFVSSLTLSNARQGVAYLFSYSKESWFKPRMWIDAISQNAFDTGAGAGLMLSYATYMTQRDPIVFFSKTVPWLNNLVSLICGTTIFACIFSTLTTSFGFAHNSDVIQVLKEGGQGNTGLTFIWMPVLFNTISPQGGKYLATIFFLCTSFAGFTSLMANVEMFTQALVDYFSIPETRRKYFLLMVLGALFVGSLPSALNINVLANQDFVWGFGLMINGIIFSLMILVDYGAKPFQEFVVNNYSHNSGDWHLRLWWRVVLWMVPVEGALVLCLWAVDLVNDDENKWSELGNDTLSMALLQWSVLLVVIFLVGGLVSAVKRCKRRPRTGERAPLVTTDSASGTNDSGQGMSTSFTE